MVLVIECVDALVDREGDEGGAIGRGERTGGENPAERGPDLGEGLVGGETPGVRLPAEPCCHDRELFGHAPTFEVAPHGGVEQRARFTGEGRESGKWRDRLLSGIELLGQDGDPRILATAVEAAT